MTDDELLMNLPSLAERRASWWRIKKRFAPIQIALVLVGSSAIYWVADKLLEPGAMLPAWTAVAATAVFALILSGMWVREGIASYPTQRDIQFDLRVRRAIHASDQRGCALSGNHESTMCVSGGVSSGSCEGASSCDGYGDN